MTTALADGAHTFEVRATDAAGNTGAAASLAFTVDTVGPAVTLDGPSGLTNDATPTFEFASEEGVAFDCALGGTSGACESPYVVVEPLADGDYAFEVAGDRRGREHRRGGEPVVHGRHRKGRRSSLTGPSEVTNDSTPTFMFGSGGRCELWRARSAARSPPARARTR